MKLLEPIGIGCYLCIGLGTWRILCGAVAWKIHLGATVRRGNSPEMQDWVGAAMLTALLAVLWPAVALFSIPWPMKSKTELSGERQAQRTRLRDLTCENERTRNRLERGDIDG